MEKLAQFTIIEMSTSTKDLYIDLKLMNNLIKNLTTFSGHNLINIIK